MRLRSKLKWCFVLSIVVFALNLLSLVLDLTAEEFEWFYIVFDGLYTVASLICVVLFGMFRTKGLQQLKKLKKIFVVAVVCAMISSLILGMVAIFAYFEFNFVISRAPEDEQTILAEGRVVPTAEEIQKKLILLDEMLKNGKISKDEYEKLRQEILDEIAK